MPKHRRGRHYKSVVCATCLFLPLAIAPLDGEWTTIASWYGPGFQGKKTASGQVFDQNKLTAASRDLPFGSEVTVINPRNNRICKVVINDRGPFVRGRGIDLSRAAAQRLGIDGIGPVICYTGNGKSIYEPQSDRASDGTQGNHIDGVDDVGKPESSAPLPAVASNVSSVPAAGSATQAAVQREAAASRGDNQPGLVANRPDTENAAEQERIAEPSTQSTSPSSILASYSPQENSQAIQNRQTTNPLGKVRLSPSKLSKAIATAYKAPIHVTSKNRSHGQANSLLIAHNLVGHHHNIYHAIAYQSKTHSRGKLNDSHLVAYATHPRTIVALHSSHDPSRHSISRTYLAYDHDQRSRSSRWSMKIAHLVRKLKGGVLAVLFN